MSSILATFLASVKSVGTACTMAMVGVYLHQRGLIDASGKRALAVISQQVTFPLFLFTKIIYCNQDWSPEPCPDVTTTLQHGWMLLCWPLYVVTAGLVIGQVMARLTSTPKVQHKSVWAAIAFGNSTGLPITLLAVVHANFPATSDLGRIDPTLFLSVYLLLYPVLQWGMGGWLLAPEENEEKGKQIHKENKTREPTSDVEAAEEHRQYETTIGESFSVNVLNHPKASNYFDRRRCSSNDEGIYLSEVDLVNAYAAAASDGSADSASSSVAESVGLDYTHDDSEDKPLLPPEHSATISYRTTSNRASRSQAITAEIVDKPRPCYRGDIIGTLKNVAARCFQPPVVGALLGMIVAVIHPLRGILVDLIDRRSHAPLEWIFDGLYSVGQAAVPINMLILGCNLSNSYNQYSGKSGKGSKAGLFSNKTMMGILVGKMIVMPVFGIVSAIFLRLFVLDVPEDVAASFYLVLMIVFLTPTANNVMVMVELSGSNTKEGIASVIALQYVAAPILLSITMSAAIGMASRWT